MASTRRDETKDANQTAMPDAQNTAAPAPKMAPDPYTNAKPTDPYSQPTPGFVSFDRVFGDNAKNAQVAADKVATGVAARAADAQNALRASEANYLSQNRGNGAGYTPDASTVGAYGTAGQYVQNLGTTGGIQANMGPNASAWGAGLAGNAGAQQFAALQNQFGRLGDDLTNAPSAMSTATDARTARLNALGQYAPRTMSPVSANRPPNGLPSNQRVADPSMIDFDSTSRESGENRPWWDSLFG